MPYAGVPKELTAKMDSCVKKIMKDGKSKDAAVALCKTSIMSQTKPKKEKPWKIVSGKTSDLQIDSALEGKDYENRFVFFSNSSFAKEEKKLNATKEGKLLKGVEIFKAGTYRGIEYKKSALDKMVAHFHYLKSYGIFPHVPVRADHPSFGFFGGGGDIIDKVGGYIADLKREGKKLVADFRITSENMWSKIAEGTYVNRSAEIGTYDDNEGTVYSPVLFGVAWVDIPAVEGLSPTFSYSKDNKNIELITLNNLTMEDEKKDVFPEEESTEEKADKPEDNQEESAETSGDDSAGNSDAQAEEAEPSADENPSGDSGNADQSSNEQAVEQNSKTFEKQFPNEAEELKKYRQEAFELFFDGLVRDGKVLPKDKEKEVAFAQSLSVDQLEVYKKLKKEMPTIVKFDDEKATTDQEEPEGGKEEPTAEEKAEQFINETN